MIQVMGLPPSDRQLVSVSALDRTPSITARCVWAPARAVAHQKYTANTTVAAMQVWRMLSLA